MTEGKQNRLVTERKKYIKIPTLADTIVSNKGRYYGAGGGTRTHTMSPPTDFESVTSTIPSHRQFCYLHIIYHLDQNSKHILPIHNIFIPRISKV